MCRISYRRKPEDHRLSHLPSFQSKGFQFNFVRKINLLVHLVENSVFPIIHAVLLFCGQCKLYLLISWSINHQRMFDKSKEHGKVLRQFHVNSTTRSCVHCQLCIRRKVYLPKIDVALKPF